MAKAKKNWRFHLLKSLFSCESKSNSKPKPQKEKSKGWRWIFGRLMLKQLPTTPAPKSLSEAREEQRKHAMNVAKATAAAAEAAVAAAQAAAEVVRLTGVSRPASLRHHESQIQNLAAIKIQTAFRGYIARKALRALKGVVRIQALARGRAVRRRVRTSLKNLPSKHPNTVITVDTRERNQSSKLESKSLRHWSDTLCSKEEFESVYHKRQEAVIRRERMKQYSFSHRERQYPHISEETTPAPNSKRHTTCLRRQWAPDDNLYNFHPSTRLSDHLGGATNLRIKPRNSARQRGEFVEEEVSSPFSHPRRSFCHLRPKTGGGDDCQLATSPSFPAYMAATESARAKMRSMSTPRQRLGYLDTCCEQGSWSSFNGEVSTLSSAAIGKSNLSQSKSSLSMGVFHYA